ncbi:NAD(P)/FAD-dependent oxidoreductase [Nakamurella deserti]|uniref:NAD(P)/FAD-dependent oxidoreductase n=1 Tax=Nakamurella deserti TaxID=2164074 RepID=UPI000DBE27E4|nr:NAD(P)/FAD-dependent oxidoreductase [Nakamurella deserti]
MTHDQSDVTPAVRPDADIRPTTPPGAPARVGIIGAGPAGLTAAHELAVAGMPAVVLEASDTVGGISRTVERDGWRFDIGGHRFFTKVPAVERFWQHILPDGEFLLRPRMSRIYYNGRLFDYPLKPLNALGNLGLLEAVRCVASYVHVRIRPPADQSHFEGWVAARFGWRLYRTFFKTYTEKVWGVPATTIQADWAAQRIKNLSLLGAIRNAVLPRRSEREITTLISEFRYPKLGPGMMWEAARDRVRELGVEVRMQAPVTRIERGPAGVTALHTTTADADGTSGEDRIPVSEVISSMPLSELVSSMSPPAPEAVRQAADDLRYRDFLTVALVVPEEFSFPDNWIYIHDPQVSVGRIQNFGSWSPYLVKDGRTCLGLEYFVTEGDALWTSDDDDLIRLAQQELARLGLVPAGSVETGYVVRQPKAYPVYDDTYQRNVEIIRGWIGTAVPNVHPVGRNGMHRYNNADHSMLTAMLTVENIGGATPPHDIWSVNVEQDYHEEDGRSAGAASDGAAGTGRAAPVLPRPAVPAARTGTASATEPASPAQPARGPGNLMTSSFSKK